MVSARPDQVTGVSDLRIARVSPLTTPADLLESLPLEPELADVVLRGRAIVEAILAGSDDRLLVVVGPCSVHDVDAALEYARRLREQAARHEDDLLIAMRVYFEKPRTTVGWKGLINDPHLDGSGDVDAGVRTARELLLEVLRLGLPVGCEFLDPITPQYIADTVAWGAIGARTVESQVHRQLASGLSLPIGMKNRPDGSISTAIDAINAALGQLSAAGLPERLIVDCSHGNSNKDHLRQPIVADDVAGQLEAGQQGIKGVMLESFLIPGRQDLGGELAYGQSVTDACMGWEPTVGVLERLALASAKRRALTDAAQ